METFNDILEDEMDKVVTEQYLNHRTFGGISPMEPMTDDDVKAKDAKLSQARYRLAVILAKMSLP